ncbi:hypothetical protein SNEBB_000925 [Seison nebaliae]|nr:hypothetical protein SNEBB_000925 [Seison nebaliae]
MDVLNNEVELIEVNEINSKKKEKCCDENDDIENDEDDEDEESIIELKTEMTSSLSKDSDKNGEEVEERIISQLIGQGAESRVYKMTKENGDEYIVKERVHKDYRITELNSWLLSQRHNAELRGLKRAKQLELNVPKVLGSDLKKLTIEMTLLPFVSLKDSLRELENKLTDEDDDPTLSILKNLMDAVGGAIGKMHNGHLIHGDLTTSNILVENNNEIYLIDFGLCNYSTTFECKAVDLNVMDRCIRTTNRNSDFLFTHLLQGYAKELVKENSLEQIEFFLGKYEKVKSRGRKRDMIG